jgi:hypothetical protein
MARRGGIENQAVRLEQDAAYAGHQEQGLTTRFYKRIPVPSAPPLRIWHKPKRLADRGFSIGKLYRFAKDRPSGSIW